MSSLSSRTSPISLLKADGGLEPLPLRPAPFQPGFVVLAREKCLFEYFPVVAGLKARSAVTAARLHADTAAPYQRSGALITHKGQGFGIWWWDAQWVAERLAAAGLDPLSKVVPETMVRAAGEGWRIVRASPGYEAQLWRQGFLIADQWRRTAFDAAGWQDFVRVQPDQTGADSAVLMAQEAPFTLQSPYRRTVLTSWTSERKTQFAVAAAIAVLICGSLYLVGDAFGLKRDTDRIKSQTAQLKTTAPGGRAAQGQLIAMTTLRTSLEGPNAMEMLREAQEIIEPFGYKIIAFDTSRQGLSVTLPKAAVDDLDGIARQLSASGQFNGLTTSLDRDGQTLHIMLTAKGAKPKAKAKTIRTKV